MTDMFFQLVISPRIAPREAIVAALVSTVAKRATIPETAQTQRRSSAATAMSTDMCRRSAPSLVTVSVVDALTRISKVVG